MTVWQDPNSGRRLILTDRGELMREGHNGRFHGVITPLYGKGATEADGDSYAEMWGYVRA